MNCPSCSRKLKEVNPNLTAKDGATHSCYDCGVRWLICCVARMQDFRCSICGEIFRNGAKRALHVHDAHPKEYAEAVKKLVEGI